MKETPLEYTKIREKFQKAYEEQSPVLYELNEVPKQAYSVVLKITYVGPRWATGVVTYNRIYGTEKVPYTIHYGDLWTRGPQNAGRNVKVVFQGESAFS